MTIHRMFSVFDMIRSISLRLILLILIVYFEDNYQENPNVIMILIIISSIIFICIGTTIVTVTEDRILVKDNSILQLFLGRFEEYSLLNIKFAFIPKKEQSNKSEVAIVLLLLTFFPSQRHQGPKIGSPIYLNLKDDNQIQIDARLNESKAKKLVNIINLNTGNKN